MSAFRASIARLLARFGAKVVRSERYKELERKEASAADFEFLKSMPMANTGKLLELIERSKGQLRQDLFVLSQLDFKRNGYFVEFGAASGVDLSNTYLLEKEYGWSGILSEPAKVWHESLQTHRDCVIDTSCVWSKTGYQLPFTEVAVAELSTISEFAANDAHSKVRTTGKQYTVQTISLENLLELHSAPSIIDYLSIDTEGSEYEILKSFNFTKYKFRVITCEHNYTSQREKIFNLLSRMGYMRVHEDVSNFDDWYVLESE